MILQSLAGLGTLAVGGTAYALMPGETCQPPSLSAADPALSQTGAACTTRSSSSRGGGGGYSRSSRFSFFGGDSSSRSGSAGGAESPSGVSRGGSAHSAMRSASAAADPRDAVKSPYFAGRIAAHSATRQDAAGRGCIMKRSRRVVLTLMGSAAISAVSARLAMARPITCGPGFEAVPSPYGDSACRAITHGFGGRYHHFHGGGLALGHGHGHAGG